MQLDFHRVLVPVLGTQAAASAGTGPLGEAGSTAAAPISDNIIVSRGTGIHEEEESRGGDAPTEGTHTKQKQHPLDRGSQRFWGPVSCRRRHDEQPRIDSTEHLFLTGAHQESPTGGVFSTLQHPKETSESIPFVTGC